ncbi:MAG: mismatch repair protein MutL, partial [Firmicutes bacterium]|nr:mismatch repair protein MutL [Bacillota bacterium]
DWRMVGELLHTYIVVEQGETVYLIDKHAAHERINFDRMKAGTYEPMAQSLLEPLVLSLPPEEGAALLAQLSLLEEFGFLAEDFGGGALVVRQIPFDISPGQVEDTLSEIARGLLTGGGVSPAAARDHLLHTMSCKAAIKGGQKNAPEELHIVAKAVLNGEVKYCPHGRPVAVTLTRAQLERQFGRA